MVWDSRGSDTSNETGAQNVVVPLIIKVAHGDLSYAIAIHRCDGDQEIVEFFVVVTMAAFLTPEQGDQVLNGEFLWAEHCSVRPEQRVKPCRLSRWKGGRLLETSGVRGVLLRSLSLRALRAITACSMFRGEFFLIGPIAYFRLGR